MIARAETPCEDAPARHMAMLDELAGTGLRIARALGAEVEALAADEDMPAPDKASAMRGLASAYDRVSRAVRLSIMLHDQLLRGLTRDAPDRKDEVRRIMVRVGEHEGRYRDRTVREIADRLDRDFCGELQGRPLSEVIAQISKDLGMQPDWPRLAGEAWAQDELNSDAVGWPLADFRLVGDDWVLDLPGTASGSSP